MIRIGLDRLQFRDKFFEKRPLFKHACFDPSSFGWTTIDQALDFQDPTREFVKILHNGRVEPSQYIEEYMDIGVRRRRILKERLYELLSGGATLVLNRIELVSQAVREICLEVGRFVGAQTTANAYACLGGEAATKVHWDTHDVFVVQLCGRKHWRVYEPLQPLPISSQVSNGRTNEVPADPMIDAILEAGDVLYVPRGWWHRVVPVAGSDTIHLAVGIHTPLILDYLIWACSTVLPEFLELRHSLLGERHDGQRVAEAAKVISESLQRPETLQSFYVRSQERERVVSPFNISMLLEQRGRQLPASVKLMLNARHPDGTSPDLIVNGRPVGLSGTHQQVARALSRENFLTLEALGRRLPSIPADTLQDIVKELVRVDVVHVSAGDGIAAT